MFVEDHKALSKSFPCDISKYRETREEFKESRSSHWHNYIEITYVEKGSAVYYVNDRVYVVEAGDIIIFNHRESHRWKVTSDEIELTVLVFSSRIISDSMNEMDMDYLVPFLKRGSNFQNKITKNECHGYEIAKMMNEIYQEYTKQESGYYLIIKADIMRLLSILVRHYQKETDGLKEVSTNKQAMKRLEETLDYIKHTYDNRITLEEAANRANMCPNYFSSYFKKVTGYRFQEYISKLRMEKAKMMLVESDLGILDIALDCGITNVSNFYRQYKKFYGVTPGEERNKKAV
ncbi:MAG TPA: AraC family transcriptional regulator [Candidatus Dorea intestinavium]|nr:AraC family transcriptional regulator [Candidatus Dorea intestinavium]